VAAAPPFGGITNAAPGPQISAAEIAALLAQGDMLFSKGDFVAARLFYERAANAGEGRAALRLGETFDPVFLDRARLRGARGDLSTARFWYRRARDLGVSEAETLLNTPETK
jgi:TPR repeat protein